MGIAKKDAMKSYWSVDSVLSTPFPRNVISHSDFYNILLFLHCCSSTDYPSKGQPGYDPRKKLGKVLTILQEQFAYVWILKQHLSIDKEQYHSKGKYSSKSKTPASQTNMGWKLSSYVTLVVVIVWYSIYM